MPMFRIAKKNVVFIHVPKTGGTSVEQALGVAGPMGMHSRNGKQLKSALDGPLARPIPLQHFHGSLLQACLDPGLVDYAFMIVRSPAERLISEYQHCRMRGCRIDAFLPFSAWLRYSLAAARVDPSYRNNHFRPQSEFACFGAEVFRLEDGLEKCLGHVAGKLGLQAIPALPHARKSDHGKPQPTDGDRALIARFYAADYAAYDYQPGF